MSAAVLALMQALKTKTEYDDDDEDTCQNVDEWGFNSNNNNFGFTCSKCGALVYPDEMGYSPLIVNEEVEPLHYCPYCGAKIVEVESNE